MMDGQMDPRELAALKRQKLRAEREDSGDTLTARQEALQVALNTLGERLEVLEQRLQPVLRDPEPTQDLHATPSDSPTSPLGLFLRAATGHAAELTGRVGELIDRVDL